MYYCSNGLKTVVRLIKRNKNMKLKQLEPMIVVDERDFFGVAAGTTARLAKAGNSGVFSKDGFVYWLGLGVTVTLSTYLVIGFLVAVSG